MKKAKKMLNEIVNITIQQSLGRQADINAFFNTICKLFA